MLHVALARSFSVLGHCHGHSGVTFVSRSSGGLDVEADAVGAAAAGEVDAASRGVAFELATDGGAGRDTTLRLALGLQARSHSRASLSGR